MLDFHWWGQPFMAAAAFSGGAPHRFQCHSGPFRAATVMERTPGCRLGRVLDLDGTSEAGWQRDLDPFLAHAFQMELNGLRG